MPLSASSLAARLSHGYRAERMARFLDYFRPGPQTTVLDIGGNPAIWESVPAGRRPRILYLNMPRAAEAGDDRGRLVFGDGCRLPFRDRSFDIAFSNSVIEHVGSQENQRRFASEVCRVGRSYWVQTPNRLFPVEQHLMTPFLHWLPKGVQRRLVPDWTVWRWMTKADPEQRRFYGEHFLKDVRLLDRDELKQLFPGCGLIAERTALGLLAKSLIAASRLE